MIPGARLVAVLSSKVCWTTHMSNLLLLIRAAAAPTQQRLLNRDIGIRCSRKLQDPAVVAVSAAVWPVGCIAWCKCP